MIGGKVPGIAGEIRGHFGVNGEDNSELGSVWICSETGLGKFVPRGTVLNWEAIPDMFHVEHKQTLLRVDHSYG